MKWRSAVDRAVAPLGLTHAQYAMLSSLRGLQHRGIEPSQRELSDHTGLDTIYVSKLARALQAKGLVERSTHPADTRAVQLRLTHSGTGIVDSAITVVHALLAQLTAPLGGSSSQRTQQLEAELRVLLHDTTLVAPDEQEPSTLNGKDRPS